MKRSRVYRKAFPNEPNLDLILIDAYSAHKLYDRVLAAHRRAGPHARRQSVFGCGAQIKYPEKGDLAAAKHCGRSRCGRARPAGGVPCRLAIALKEKDFAQDQHAADDDSGQVPQSGCPRSRRATPISREYVKSPQYRSWLAATKP